MENKENDIHIYYDLKFLDYLLIDDVTKFCNQRNVSVDSYENKLPYYNGIMEFFQPIKIILSSEIVQNIISDVSVFAIIESIKYIIKKITEKEKQRDSISSSDSIQVIAGKNILNVSKNSDEEIQEYVIDKFFEIYAKEDVEEKRLINYDEKTQNIKYRTETEIIVESIKASRERQKEKNKELENSESSN